MRGRFHASAPASTIVGLDPGNPGVVGTAVYVGVGLVALKLIALAVTYRGSR